MESWQANMVEKVTFDGVCAQIWKGGGGGGHGGGDGSVRWSLDLSGCPER